MKLRIATRKSPLALAQTRWFAEQLMMRHPGLVTEEVQIVTEGDRKLDGPLSKVGGKGLFVSEVEAALIDGRADIAVHSAKDLPAKLAQGLVIGALPPREDPADVLVIQDEQDTTSGLIAPDGSEQLWSMQAGAILGTSSLRRMTQLRQLRNDIGYRVIRGNVGTRISKLAEGLSAVVLAAAGINRLGLKVARHRLDPSEMIPAVAQGILAIECRQDDPKVQSILGVLDDPQTRFDFLAERAWLDAVGGDCSTPLAAYVSRRDGAFYFDAWIGSLCEAGGVRSGFSLGAGVSPNPVSWGAEIARDMLENGGRDVLAKNRTAEDPYQKWFVGDPKGV